MPIVDLATVRHVLCCLFAVMRQGTSNHPLQLGRAQVWLRPLIALTGLTMALLTGCTGTQRYIEEHEIKQLKVVFLDEQSLRERWAKIAGRAPIQFAMPMTTADASVKTVRGFYDYSTNTLYCEKWNFEVCGHELHHAALGQFHPSH